MFTFLERKEIEEINEKQLAAPETRVAQKALAWEVVKDIHGKDEADNAVAVSQKLFAGDFSGLSVKDIKLGLKGVPSFKLSEPLPLVEVLVQNKIASSKREAREFIKSGAILVNGKTATDESMVISNELAIEGKMIVFRRGKKKYYLAEI